ncbi:MAG: hypothetical protein WC708_07875 [Lentisphaeria bacterium]
MFTIIRLTLYRVKEPAYLFLALIGFGLAWTLRHAGAAGLNVSPVLFGPERPARVFSSALLLALAVIYAVFTGAGEVPRDIRTRFASLLLSKPLRRWEYVAGRAGGVFLLCFGTYAAWLAALALFSHTAGGGPEAVAWSAVRYADYLLPGLLLAPLAGATVALTCYLDDIPVMFVLFIYVVLAWLASLIPVVTVVLPRPFQALLMAVYYLFPNPVFYFMEVTGWASRLLLVGYSFALGALWLLLAIPGFNKRDLS